MERVHIRLFGAPRIERAGEGMQFDTRKAVALLAYLAVTERPHRRDSLASLLWPDSDQVKARSALRRTLSVAGVVGPALVCSREEVSLTPELVACDVTEFGRLVGQPSSGGQREAVSLVDDDFMAGFSLRDSAVFDDWQAATADHLRDQLVATLVSVVDRELAGGDLNEALALVRRWLVADPMNESAHAHLMRLLTWQGQRPTALRQYRTLVRILDRELGVEPLPETSAVYDAIRSNQLPPPERRQRASSALVEQQSMSVPTAEGDGPTLTMVGHDRPTLTLVGRKREQQRLLASWRSAEHSAGLVGLVGEPGLGRTALSLDLAHEVSRLGGRSLVLRAHEGERGLALAAARDLVRGLTRDLAASPHPTREVAHELARLDPSLEVGADGAVPLDSPGALTRMFEAARQLTATILAGQQPGLLIIDDAHWLDPTSADLLAYVLRRLPRGILVLVTWQPGIGSTVLPALMLEQGDVVALGALAEDGVGEMIRDQGIDDLDSADVLRRTGGVPRLVQEYVVAARAGSAEAGPIRDLVRARLDSASATARQLVSAAAVLATVSDPELLRATAGRTEIETVDALEEAVARGLLVEVTDRGGYDLPHEILRGVVLERTSLARQRLLHGRAADVLIRRHAADARGFPAAAVARHLAAAGRRDEAAAWFWTSAAESRELYAHREELEQLQAAQAAGFEPTLIHEAAGDALTRLGHYRDALTAYEQAAATNQDDQALAVIEHKLANVHDRLGEWTIAQAHLESAAELLESASRPDLRARVGADLALVLHRQGARDLAMDTATAAVTLAEASDDALALAQIHNVLGVLATGRGELLEATHHLERSAGWGAELPDVGQAVAAANNLARVYELIGRHDDALLAARRALALGERHGDRHRVGALHTNLADLLHRSGLDDEARLQARAAAEAFADVDDASVRPQVWTLVEW